MLSLSRNNLELDFLTIPPNEPSHEIYGAVRGICVYLRGCSLVGEGMGIGGVIAVRDDIPFFPLDVYEESRGNSILRRYVINGQPSKVILGRKKIDKVYNLLHRLLSPIYLRNIIGRGIYTYLMLLRSIARIRNRFEKTKPIGVIPAEYIINDNEIKVRIDLTKVDADNVFIANELSGRLFTKLYLDDREVDNIGPWIEINNCSHITIYSPYLRLGFRIPALNSCRMFAGREVVGKRLDWAGVSFSAKPVGNISYKVVLTDGIS